MEVPKPELQGPKLKQLAIQREQTELGVSRKNEMGLAGGSHAKDRSSP